MCGIAGFIDASGSTGNGELARTASTMAACLRHRGPDDDGVWADEAAGVALSHRRLSVIDLSPEGHQPMESADGRWVIVFNGEMYNFASVRRQLEQGGHRFRGRCDTEVLLGAVSRWGVEGALERCNGMFALALWDRRQRQLWLARDRLGEKPLYYGHVGGVFLFASELKALRQHPGFSAAVDRTALSAFLRHGYVPSPASIYTGVHKLAPGWLLHVGAGGRSPRPRPYWRAGEVLAEARRHPVAPAPAVDELERLLLDSVKIRLAADVPLGTFLSGGIDSSLVVALTQAQVSRPVRTFSIGFAEAGYDEADHARQVARHLGTDHTELYVTASEAMAVIPRLPEIYDEPFADSSQIPTCLVAGLARHHVTVALSGDGGDELFLGYDRYRWIPPLARGLHRSPGVLRRAVARSVAARSPEEWDRLARRARPWTPGRLAQQRVGDRLHRLTDLIDAADPLDLHRRVMSHWQDPAVAVIGDDESPPSATVLDHDTLAALSVPERLAFVDTITYLPDDILTKVDRASMAVGLEARIPLLDPRVVELAWRMPLDMKLRRGTSKWPLRQVLHRYVPERLFQRPKMGFNLPVGAWLRGPLREWAEAQLDPRRIASEGYLRPQPVQAVWSDHLEGRGATTQALWDVLIFQSWVEQHRR